MSGIFAYLGSGVRYSHTIAPMRRSMLIAALLLLVFALQACGGSGGSSSQTTALSTSATSSTTTAASQVRAGKSANGTGTPKAQAPKVSHALRSFITHGGDNSIQESGAEASTSELAQASAALHGYIDARTSGRWAKACSYLAKGFGQSYAPATSVAVKQQARGARVQLQSIGCPQLIQSMSAGMPPNLRRDLRQVTVGALRIREGHAFLLYHGAHHQRFFIQMVQEGGQWKVSVPEGSALP
jgi:hypothetical protein